MDFTEDEIERFLNETGPMSVAKAKYLFGFRRDEPVRTQDSLSDRLGLLMEHNPSDKVQQELSTAYSLLLTDVRDPAADESQIESDGYMRW